MLPPPPAFRPLLEDARRLRAAGIIPLMPRYLAGLDLARLRRLRRAEARPVARRGIA